MGRATFERDTFNPKIFDFMSSYKVDDLEEIAANLIDGPK